MGTPLAFMRPNLLQQIPVVNQLIFSALKTGATACVHSQAIFSALKMGATACVHSRALDDVIAVGGMVASAFRSLGVRVVGSL